MLGRFKLLSPLRPVVASATAGFLFLWRCEDVLVIGCGVGDWSVVIVLE